MLAVQRMVVIHGVDIKVKMVVRETPALIYCVERTDGNETFTTFTFVARLHARPTINKQTAVVFLSGTRKLPAIKLRYIYLGAARDIVSSCSHERTQRRSIGCMRLR